MEYEIYDNNKTVGTVKVYNSIKKTCSIINSKKNTRYKLLPKVNNQTYIVNAIINSDDDLYDIVNIYKETDIFEEIDKLKKHNNISRIKKNTKMEIIIPYSALAKFKIKKENIDVLSVLNSKVNFIKNVYLSNKKLDLKDRLNKIIIDFNNFKKSSEYEFLTDEERNKKVSNIYIKEANKLINYIETLTNYRYTVDFITPILTIK